MTKEFTCYTHLAKNLPKKFLILTQKNHFSNRKNRFSTQRKNFLYSPPKNQFFKRKNFSHPFQRTVHLVHSAGPPKKENSTQNVFYTYPKKNDFQTKKIFTPTWKNRFSTQRKHLFICPPKNQFFKRKSFSRPFQRNVHLVQSHDPPKKRKFYPKNFLYLTKNFNFLNEKFFQAHLKELIFYPKKTFLIFKLPLGALRQSRLWEKS